VEPCFCSSYTPQYCGMGISQSFFAFLSVHSDREHISKLVAIKNNGNWHVELILKKFRRDYP
jgi:hypothetical protein